MAKIPEEKIQEVINKADIVDVISKYTNLQKQGRNYVGLCLFHQDQSPSMIVSPDKKIFKCFSCGVGGNVIQFVEKMNGISFPEAVVKLAKDYNVDLGDFEKMNFKKDPYSAKQKLLFEINEEAMKYYQAILFGQKGKEAKDYLDKRKIDKNQIIEWGIGYAYENNLLKHLVEVGYHEDDIITAGLATRNDESGRVYDYFRNRVVFPIKNRDGYVIGFSGRLLTDEKPKYLNTRETPVFKKSEVMFNIDWVWRNKERYQYILVLEGFMDVISLKKINYDNSLALMGTSVSTYHLNTFKQLKKPLKIFLDGDGPGIKAMFKMSKALLTENIPFTIVDNLTNSDPDELVNGGKQKELEKMIDNSVNVYDFFITKFMQNKDLTIDLKNEIINKIFELLACEKNLITVDSVIDELSQKLNISKETLLASFKQKSNKKIYETNRDQPMIPTRQEYVENRRQVNKITPNQAKKVSLKSKNDDMKLSVLVSLVKSDDYLKKIEENISYISGSGPKSYFYQTLYQTIIGYYQSGRYEGNNIEKLVSLLSAEKQPVLSTKTDELIKILSTPSSDLKFKNKFTEQELDDIIYQAKLEMFEKEVNEVTKDISKIENQLGNQDLAEDKQKELRSDLVHKLNEASHLLKQKSCLIDSYTTKERKRR
ncbi:DNA primase [Mesoplasma lactucae]|uniref:DNA primase n=1 Tax=Mesoplasma lactucae TaxID=138853 RepID=UPI002022A28B|nr:DNA primase [Mesoplasma lactucae]MCL8216943.1 DNA primase [Mesoplasma lactucae ATCC 49193]